MYVREINSLSKTNDQVKSEHTEQNTDDVLLDKYKQQIGTSVSNVGDIVNPPIPKNDLSDVLQKINVKIVTQVEQQKIKLRQFLTYSISIFVVIQLIFFSLIVGLIVASVTIEHDYFKTPDALAALLFDFLEYYISATIVELLGMYAFILHYVFSDRKISDIFKRK